jgi:predicted dehydrogenase
LCAVLPQGAAMDVAIIGCGFVADFYVQSIRRHPSLRLVAAMDIVPAHAERFGRHWNCPTWTDLDRLLDQARFGMALILTTPDAHVAISRACLAAGRHVYCEKPLALDFAAAQGLAELAAGSGLMLGSAPCNHLSEAVQAIHQALAAGVIGVPRVAYAEMDDNFLALAPYRQWTSASGAPWPYENEFVIGCTLEHAAYHLTWLCFLFGPVRRVVASAALQHRGKPIPPGAIEAPDLSVASLHFHSGMVARLTCSILAPHDHALRIIGTEGVLQAPDCWFYRTQVSYRRYVRIRRRFMLNPLPRRLKLAPTGPAARRTGAGAVDFARGPAAMALSLEHGGPDLMPTDFMLHFTEVMLAMADPGDIIADISSSFAPLTRIATPIL